VTAPEELRKAAARLRDLAADASTTPWMRGEGYVRKAVWTDGGLIVVCDRYAEPGDLAWIATLHPGIAQPLADWLESVADAHIHLDDREISAFDLPGTSTHPALDVARIINGGQP
jgi:hypothetical protein